MRWVPTFQYTDEDPVDVAFMLPIGLWRHTLKQTGGDIESDAAFPAAYIVRRDYQLSIPLRFYEGEWSTVRAMIEFGQLGGIIKWFPDLDSEESFEVYLDDPSLGDDIVPQVDDSYPRALTIALVIRRVDGLPWDLEYFAEAA